MRPFVFSCDAHIVEPPDLFTKGLPANLQHWAPNVEIDDKRMRLNKLGNNVIFKIPVDFHTHKVGDSDDLDVRRLGARDLKLRFADMERDGVDAELVFPSLGLLVSRIPDRDASREACRLYNDWAWDYLEGIRSKLIPAAIIPLVNIEDGIEELKRVIAKGFRAVMMPPAGLDSAPRYNDPAWDTFVALCAEAKVPMVFHTGTGNVNLRAIRGPGAALFNYARQMNDAVDVIAALIGGGILDRNPDAHILFVEAGAGWLLGLAERMDEVYEGHAPSIHPKLSRKPSQIVRDQVHCSFQNDLGCLLTIKGLGIGNFLFATDYPHSEGTFPYSRELVAGMFEQVPELSEEDKAALLGLNAARMFGITPQQVAEETRRVLSA
ncbi:amidohydrolase|uniref:amidohydrolase family protein n=1 Tax=unclassified Pseudomonas TaxID=196821 RepID=UPI0012FDE5F9|nr:MULTISPECIES: amidohydrolase family protein [unclassified Pseudomonas]MVV48812.1 amidohydrolase [Pseudomonas sp. PB120]NYU03341.1 amidohydrolase [Pseudomonas sp. SbOxS1]